MILRQIHDLPAEAITPLADSARSEGFDFLDRLLAEWRGDVARFDRPGECLIGAHVGTRLVAVGGIHRDPFLNAATTARLRRVYVAPDWRRKGVASALVNALLSSGRNTYTQVRLRVPNHAAARFYEAIGFVPFACPDATHILQLD